MKRIILMLTVAAFMVAALAVTAPLAFAASPSQTQCEADGGTFSRDGGQVSCTTTDTGKPHPNNKFDEVTTEESNGTLQNQPKHKESSECTDTGSKKCPPGQF